MESAQALANKSDDRTRKEFEKWAMVTYSNNHATINHKKGADKGIDGIIITVQEIIEEQKRLDTLLALEVLKCAKKQMEVKQGSLDLA